ncbi:MAG: LysE family translocator [Acidimicrobiaceae bacterium]|nr:LysE family translocator [Acidimicrobiaceae bacterium]
MIDSAHLTQFFVASILIIMVPGPSVLFTLARGVAWGRTVAVLTVLGNSLGTLLLSMVVALGLGPLLSHSRVFSIVLQLAGGCYLLFLGVDALRHRHEHAQAMAQREATRPSPRRIIRQGFVVGVLNPKSLIFFAAVFPHFVNRSQGRITEQLVVFGLLFSIMAFCSDGAWGLIAGTAREWLSGSATRLVVLRSIGGCVMCILGVLIIITALSP